MEEKLKLVQRLDFILDACKGKRVLHLGCTNYPYTEDAIRDGSLLHFAIQNVATEVYGFDMDEKGMDILRSHGSTHLYYANLEELDKVPLNETFDVIIAGEMIEHLNNPGLFLKGIQRFCRPDTKLIVTTINAYCGMRFFHYAFTKRYGRNEPVHPDHVMYYSYHTLTEMLNRYNYDIEDFMFYDLGHEHRPTTPRLFRIVNDIAVRFAHQFSDGVIAVCRVKGSETAN